MIDLGYLRKRLKIAAGPLEVRTRSQEHHAIFAINLLEVCNGACSGINVIPEEAFFFLPTIATFRARDKPTHPTAGRARQNAVLRDAAPRA